MPRLFSVIFVIILLLTIPFNISAFAEQGKDTNSFSYIDTDSGVTFTVPANWKQEELSKDREYIDVKFVFTEEDGYTMIYGSTDMWELMSASEKIGYTRSEFNNSIFTKSDIAEMYNTSADKINTVIYNGVQYFKSESNFSSNIFGMDITVAMTQLVCIDNGWMYMFQFSGTDAHELYSDFENLLKSVQYPTASNVGGIGSANKTNSGTNNDPDDISGVVAVVLLLVIVAIIVVAVVVSRKKNTASAPEQTTKAKPTIYCTNCGQALPLDSDFCHICGIKIEKEF